MAVYVWVYIIIGVLWLALPWLKKMERHVFLNAPMVALFLGIGLYLLPINLPNPSPIEGNSIILKLAEITVIVSLMGAGLKLDRGFSFKAYRIPLLLVLVTMILCIAAVSLIGIWAGLVPASAVLLGAVFAPTDPVLASDVQVDPEENEDEEHEVQFSLTAEAGLNDGLAFPFTWFAVMIAMYGLNITDWGLTWFLQDVVYRIAIGLAVGYGVGKLMCWIFLHKAEKYNIDSKHFGFLAIAITFFTYGFTEAIHAYGFIAVFVAALTLKQQEKQNKMHYEMHNVIEQLEGFLVVAIMFLLGGYIVQDWFGGINIELVIVCIAFIFIIRPLFGIIPTLGSEMVWKERGLVAFLGIKGVGSFFYLAFALHETGFEDKELLWSATALLVVISAIIHRIVGFYYKNRMSKG
jgi:NhaP-type Na+/H+ or K+/H+ antiporter